MKSKKIMKEELLKLQKEIHANAVTKGFWKPNPSKEQVLMLVITEIAEVVEADRKDKRFDKERKKGYYFAMNRVNNSNYSKSSRCEEQIKLAYINFIKGTIEEELADVAIRLLDFMAGFDIEIDYKTFECYKGIKSIEDLCTMMFYITKLLVDSLEKEFWFSIVVGDIFETAKALNIDLIWHIKEKMRYNKTRPMLHNKKY